jgi:hypothetical protein
MLYNLKLWWTYTGKYLHHDIIQGIKNLIYWFPVIWRDRDWDTTYIWNILSYKLKKQAINTGKYGLKYDSDKMLTCAKLIDKINNDEYMTEYLDYDKSLIKLVPDKHSNSHVIFYDNSQTNFDDFDEYINKYKSSYRKVIKDIGDKNKKTIAMNISSLNHDRAHKLLFKIMERDITKWWN